MSQFRVTAQARADMGEIWLYIAQDNLEAANRVIDSITARFPMLADHPKLGRARDELSPDLRSHPAGHHLIFYRPMPDGVEIVRVLSGYRDLEAEFEQ
jgi:toxin ParE1/3/4